MNDPYKILGIDYNASNDEIKKAYKYLAKKTHPDKGGNEKEFKKINEAYENLTKESPINNFPELFMFNLFGEFRDFISVNPVFKTTLKLTLEELETGGDFVVKYKRNVKTGKVSNTTIKIGIGSFTVKSMEETEKEFEITIHLPKCYDERKSLLFKGLIKMDDSPNINGDLEVSLIVDKHPIFKRVPGTFNLRIQLDISLKESLIGFSKEIKLLNGETAKIECVTVVSPYDTKIIENYGMNYSSNKYGDLLINFRIEFPILISKETLNIIKKLPDI